MNLLQTLPTMGALIDVLESFVFILFVVSGLVMSVVILLQEGKGGGLGGAFGGAAADTFGVKSGTVNRFTAYLAAAFLGLALVYAGISAANEKESMELAPLPAEGAPTDAIGTTPTDEPAGEPPAEGAPAEGVPAEEGGSNEAPSDGDSNEGSGGGN